MDKNRKQTTDNGKRKKITQYYYNKQDFYKYNLKLSHVW